MVSTNGGTPNGWFLLGKIPPFEMDDDWEVALWLRKPAYECENMFKKRYGRCGVGVLESQAQSQGQKQEEMGTSNCRGWYQESNNDSTGCNLIDLPLCMDGEGCTLKLSVSTGWEVHQMVSKQLPPRRKAEPLSRWFKSEAPPNIARARHCEQGFTTFLHLCSDRSVCCMALPQGISSPWGWSCIERSYTNCRCSNYKRVALCPTKPWKFDL